MSPPEDLMHNTLAAALRYFALVFGAGFLLGSVRVPFLVPHLGVRTAELIEMPVMAIVIVLSARFIVRRFQLPAAATVRLAAGGIALALLVTAELLLAAVLQGQSIAAYIASRDPVSGSVYLLMLGAFALMPWALSWTRGAESPRAP
ncbi:MAG TPA: hypothetical protein VFK82_08305 [Burkholderiaceae bacterium]|nr:hypothetical protein [Burkholderiaceae bacterium]